MRRLREQVGGRHGEPRQDGMPFDCGAWSTDGPGILVMGVIGTDSVAGDVANVLQLDD